MGWKSYDKLVQKFDIVVIGAGASGLMVASKFQDRDIALLDTNSKIAQKLKISGGGKCNVTNEHVSSSNYFRDSLFIEPILQNFDETKLLEFLKLRGCQPILQKEHQYFCKQSSDEVINIFKKEIKDIALFLNHKVLKVSKEENFIVTTTEKTFQAKHLIVASGGVSYPKIGASDIAYDIAKSFGHTIKVTSPSLVGFTVQKEQFWMKELSGISMIVKMSVAGKSFTQDLLFAHKGVSGPVVLNASLYWQKGLIEVDFLPDKKINFYLKSNKLISSAFPIPKRFMKLFLSHIKLEDKPVSSLSKDEIEKLMLLKNYTFAPAGNFGYSKAEVTRGGINTDEINADTMMSKLVENLYFIGECLDVTGELGGYNFQWAFSSAQRVDI
jgi:predicted Rossmann fold flavoprotein